MVQLAASDVRGLRAEVQGAVVLPTDSEYDEARSLWNGAHDKRPAAVVRCASAADVAMAIEFARSRGLEIAVRGGGHNYAGLASCDGGLMINLSPMRAVAVDVDGRRAVCGGGATWADVDATTQEHGLATVGGFVSHTGIAGLTLGGGIGWLTRKAGLSSDNLLAAEVVTADGRILRAAPDTNPELYWALRGGGGNFGVVTSFEYRLHEVGPLVHLGLFFWGVERGAEALRFARDLAHEVPSDMGVFVAGLNAPPAPFVPPEYQHAPGYALLVVGFGSAEQHGEVAARVRAGMPPAWELVTPMPYVALQQMFNDSAPWGLHAYEKALYLDELTDGVVDVFTEFLPRKQSPLSIVPVFIVDGAYAKVGDEETAFGGSRQARVVFNISGHGTTPKGYEAERAWVRAFWEALRPHARNAGSYVNFMAEIEEDRVRAAYGPAKYDRLARVKAAYDPDNVFHLNANIKPAAGGA
jgi:FAD/FMN-containing dehydrogenase